MMNWRHQRSYHGQEQPVRNCNSFKLHKNILSQLEVSSNTEENNLLNMNEALDAIRAVSRDSG